MTPAETASVAVSAVDIAMLVVLAISAGVGLWRGFLFEAASLLGWVVAYFAARRGSPALQAWATLEGWVPATWSPAVVSAMAFAMLFIVVLLAWSLAARLLRKVVHATPLQLPDRLVGGVFGLVRGVVVLVVVATLVSWTPLQEHALWQESLGRQWLEKLVEGLKPFWPADGGRGLLPSG